MLGAGLQFSRSHGEDRFNNPAKVRKANQNRQNDPLRRAQSDVTASRSGSVKEKLVVSGNMEMEKREVCEEPPKPVVSPLSNLERFLESIMPSVPAQYLSKTALRGLKTCDVEFQPYFMLGDLWESFKEWSAYGAGVPLILNDCDSVVQYYVPSLSGMQIYGHSMQSSVKPRRLGEDSDGDFRDTSSDGSSDCEPERGLKYSIGQRNHHSRTSEIPIRIDRLSLREQNVTLQEEFSSEEDEYVKSQGYLLFEYLERDPPFSREPLADKISDLSLRFPELKTFRSCDLLPSSWLSVYWYPIYRIPMGPTLKDLDACFLTYHSLHTPIEGAHNSQAPVVTYPIDMDGVPKMSLPVFGLASYKFKSSLWTPTGGLEQQLANSLFQDADNWLRLLQVHHPDFLFFCSR